MIETIIVLFIGLIGGFAVGTQSGLAGAMSQKVGGAAGSFIIHIGGAVASLVYLLLRGGEQINEWRSLPWYMLGSGVLGLVLYLTLNQTIPKLGTTSAVALIIVGQLVAGVAIDHFGAFGLTVRAVDLTRVFGIMVLLFGVYLITK